MKDTVNICCRFFFVALACFAYIISNAKCVRISEFGLMPNSGIDARPFVKKAISYCRSHSGTSLRFAPGRYDFYPDGGISDREGMANRKPTSGFEIKNVKNLDIDGGGADFVFHGKMQVAAIDSSSKITLRNFTADWQRPYISQGEVCGYGDGYIDLKIDKTLYPYEMRDSVPYFIGEGWKLPIMSMYSTLYEKTSKEIAYNTWDMTLGDVFEAKAEEVGEGIIRFHRTPAIQPPIGTIVALFHVRYFANGIAMNRCKDVTLKNIKLYHTLGNGFLASRTDGVTMDNASTCVNDAKGRYFSTVADASHFSECKGLIKVVNCAHTGQGDDFINVHGTSVRIIGVAGTDAVIVDSEGKGNGWSVTPGDEYWFIPVATAQRIQQNRVVDKTPTADGKGFVVKFERPIPETIKAGDFMECKTWTPKLLITHCRILKRHRARGILVTTPQKVVIKDNYFRTAGTAILIEGDFNYWFESGANRDVSISHNIFDNCLTSGNKHGSSAEWGEAVITITPSFVPDDTLKAAYHRNIAICGNEFRVFDKPLINARSVDNLRFSDNIVKSTRDYKPYTWQKSAFHLSGCRNVSIIDNKFDENFGDITIEYKNIGKKDFRLLSNSRTISLLQLQ